MQHAAQRLPQPAGATAQTPRQTGRQLAARTSRRPTPAAAEAAMAWNTNRRHINQAAHT